MKNSLAIALKKSTAISDMHLQDNSFNLLTLHRHYNVDDPLILEHILTELGELGERIIFPVHPRTKKMLSTAYELPANIRLVDPQGYLDFIALEHAAKRIITDSGGIQKEAYILQKPCITLRSETEWVETVNEKWNLLINPAEKNIASTIMNFQVPGTQANIFGEHVTGKMINIIQDI
jgi:UDP-GlcNAc3NAcA epimerase